ncbi:MAG: cupin domain-containing protein [Frankiaceae bacterium]|nr:cupin domain-containing protein [Frankiaceae bacterium]
MSDETPAAMVHLEDLGSMIEVSDEATVSRTVMKAEGVRLVLFSFDTGQELSEHTAAVPVLLQVLDGRLSVSSGGITVVLSPGGIAHLPTRAPHSVLALVPTRLLLTMLDLTQQPASAAAT